MHIYHIYLKSFLLKCNLLLSLVLYACLTGYNKRTLKLC